MFTITQEYLDNLFPASRTDEIFEVLFGDAEDGAYDIRLSLQESSAEKVLLHYELHGRPGKCLACNLTSGLPHVFNRHPIIAAQKTAEDIAKNLEWNNFTFEIGSTEQFSEDLHFIPLKIIKG